MNEQNKLNDQRIIYIQKEPSIFGGAIKIGLGLALGITIIGGIWAFIINETGKNIVNTWIRYDLFKEEKKTLETRQKAQAINTVATQINIQRQSANQQRIISRQKELEKEAAWKAWYKPHEICGQINISWETTVECTNIRIKKKKEFEELYAKGEIDNAERKK